MFSFLQFNHPSRIDRRSALEECRMLDHLKGQMQGLDAETANFVIQRQNQAIRALLKSGMN